MVSLAGRIKDQVACLKFGGVQEGRKCQVGPPDIHGLKLKLFALSLILDSGLVPAHDGFVQVEFFL